jgi:protein arginine kinase
VAVKAASLPGLATSIPWLPGGEQSGGVVISSRVRLSRNIADYPFRPAPNQKRYDQGIARLSAVVHETFLSAPGETLVLEPAGYAGIRRRFLSDRGLAGTRAPREILFSSDESVMFLLGTTDHLRIVSTLPGMSLRPAYEHALSWDKALEPKLNYAVALDFGYLSTRIAESGSAMRASVLVHLPALTETDRLAALADDQSYPGIRVHPVGNRQASLFVVSNGHSVGFSENVILSKLEEYTDTLISSEIQARDSLARRGDEKLADAFGVLNDLKGRNSVSEDEAMQALSTLRMAALCGFLGELRIERLNMLFFLAQESHIYVKSDGKHEGENDINMARMQLIQRLLF